MDNGAADYRRYLEGDEKAFDAVLEAYRDGLIRFLDRIVHDSAVAEDLAIDTFTELIVHPKRYNFKVSLKTYLYMIGRSRALNFVKRRGRVTMLGLEEAEPLPAADPDPADTAEAAEQRRALNEALERLSPDQRTAVQLVYYEGMSYDETAAVMKKTRKQVDNLLYLAKKQLRSMIGKEGAFPL